MTVAVLYAAALTPAPAGEAAASPEASGPRGALLAVPNARIPIDGVLSGGQPTPEQIEELARGGIRTVINLRAASETGFEWEPNAVEALGLRYVSIPIAGAEGLTRANVTRIDHELEAALERGPVLLHCGSGNRIGAVLSLREAWLHGAEPEKALAFGLASGLTRLEDDVRRLLSLPPSAE